MYNTLRGLSADEHLRTAGLLHRVYAGLKGVAGILRKYPANHPVRRECNAAVADVRALQLELENAGRTEHGPAIVYLNNNNNSNTASIADALAGCGDGAGELD